MLLQQPHGDPEIQHYEKFQQRINKKNREQDPETHTEVKRCFRFRRANQCSWSLNNVIKSFFMATCILRITTYFGSTALNGELTNGTGQFAVLTEGKRMTHHPVCTAHQWAVADSNRGP